MAKFIATLLLTFLLLQCCSCLIQKLDIKNDRRTQFFVDNFGFEAGGSISLNFSGLSLDPPVSSEELEMGFIIERTQTDATSFLDESEDLPCQLSEDKELHIKSFEPHHFTYVIKEAWEGYYNIFFVSCLKDSKVSFHLDIDLHNEGYYGPIYLSSGQAPLTTVYSMLFVLYCAAMIVWVFGGIRGPDKKVFLIHYLMTLLVALKLLSILFKAFELHFLNIYGVADGWAKLYYSFSFLKGVMLFIVIALVGTGWTFIKPFLADKDKKIFLVVIPLQILDNVALVIIEEATPGVQGWFTWKDIFRLVDIVCCGAILIPIIWSIKHLKEASQIDGKAARNIEKLKLFRQFYLIVVSYIYFTRIIVYLLDATLPFRWVWLGDLFTEAATFSFFFVVGYMFRPISQNPFLHLEEEDLEQGK